MLLQVIKSVAVCCIEMGSTYSVPDMVSDVGNGAVDKTKCFRRGACARINLEHAHARSFNSSTL